jgi:hypothetical protein
MNCALKEDKVLTEVVKTWYDTHAEYEWIRLVQDGYHQLEYLVTMHFLKKYLPKHGLILDAGGGPGRYTIELAKRVTKLSSWICRQNALKSQKTG